MGVLLEKGTFVLPKVSDPPPIMGRDKDQFCKFYRAPGHKIEDCFVLKNILQDTIDKEFLTKEASGILKDPFPSHGEGWVSFINTIEVAVPINDQPLDFFRLINGHHEAAHKSSSLTSSAPKFYFELLEAR